MSVSNLLFACHITPLFEPSQRRILKLDLSTRTLHMYKKNEQRDCASLPFNDILCVIENVKYSRGLSIYTNGFTSAWPLNVFLDSDTDRDDFASLLRTCASGKHMKDTFVDFGTRCIFEFKGKKKGGMTSKSRTLRLQNYHLSIFHKEDDITPTNVISLISASFGPSPDISNSVELQFFDVKRVFQLGSTDDTRRVLECMTRMKREHIERAKERKLKREESEEEVSNLKISKGKQPVTSPAESVLSPKTPMSPPTQGSHPTPPPIGPISTPILAKTLRKIDVRVGNQWVQLAPNTMVEISKQERIQASNGGSAMKFRLISPYRGFCIQEREQLFAAVNHPQKRMRPRTKLNYNFPLNEFIRAFKPGKHHATITYWGKDHGSKKNRKVPVPSKITSLSELKLVSLNLPKEGMHGFGITQDCSLFVFGETAAHPNCNPLGLDKKLTAYRPTQVQGLGDSKIVQICGSEFHSLALGADGSVYGWGSSALTSLPTNTSSPCLIEDLSQLSIAGIAACNTHSAVWTTSGQLFTFGNPGNWLGYDWSKAYYQGNTNPMGEVVFPSFALKEKLTVQKVTVCVTHTLVLFDNGAVASFGNNDHGQLGIGSTQASTYPQFVPLPKCGDITCGRNFSIFLTQSGQIYSCGHTYHGHGFDHDLYEPRCIDSLKSSKFARVSSGNDCVYAITGLGCAVMWGRYSGYAEMVKEPKVVQHLRSWRVYDIGIGADFSMGLGVLVNKMISANGLPSVAEEEALFMESYNVPHPAPNQASSRKVINTSLTNSSTSPNNSKTMSESRSRFSRSPSHPHGPSNRVRQRHHSASPTTRRKIRRASASPIVNSSYHNKLRESISPSHKRLPQNATIVNQHGARTSKSPFDVRRHTVGAHVSNQAHQHFTSNHLQPHLHIEHESSPQMQPQSQSHQNHLQPQPARPNPNASPTVGTYSRVSRSRTPGPPLDTRRLIRRRKSEHRDPRETSHRTEEPLRNVSYSDEEIEDNKSDDETSENIYGRGSFDFSMMDQQGRKRGDTQYSEISNATSTGESGKTPRRGRADTTYSQVSNFGKSYSETRAEYLFPEPAQVNQPKSQSVKFLDDVEIHHPPEIAEVRNPPSILKKVPPPAPANLNQGGGAIPNEPKKPPPAPVDVGGAKTPPPAPPDVVKTPPPQPMNVQRKAMTPPAQPDVIKKKKKVPPKVDIKRMPMSKMNDPNAINTPPPPPETVHRRRQWQNASTPQTVKQPAKKSVSPVNQHHRTPPVQPDSIRQQPIKQPPIQPQSTKSPLNQSQSGRRQPLPLRPIESDPTISHMARQRVNTNPNRSNSSEVPPSPTMGRNKSTPLPRNRHSNQTTSPQRKSSSPLGYPPRGDWRPTPPVVDLSMVPAPPPAPGGSRTSKRNAAPVKSQSNSSFFGKRKSKRAPKTKQEKPSPADFRKARKKTHFYAQPQAKNGGGPLRAKTSNAPKKSLVAPPKLSTKHRVDYDPTASKTQEEDDTPSRFRANTSIEEVLDAVE